MSLNVGTFMHCLLIKGAFQASDLKKAWLSVIAKPKLSLTASATNSALLQHPKELLLQDFVGLVGQFERQSGIATD